MGPILILDKSALQGLSGEEINFLQKHYYLNIVPILVMEVLADLKKASSSPALSAGQVVRLARKLPSLDASFNVNYRTLCLASLLGNAVPMNGVCVVDGGHPVRSKDGEPGLLFDTPPERWAVMRWQDGGFIEAEQALAHLWRLTTKAIDLKTHRDRLAKAYLVVPSCRSLAEVREAVDRLLGQTPVQRSLLEWLMDEHDLPGAIREVIRERWRSSGVQYIDRFAPYANYCLRVELSFILALRDQLVGPKATNRIDLEYCFYLPFCMAFSSGDRLHAKLAGLFLGSDQDFVEAGVLKVDLRALADEWGELTEAERRERAYDYGDYPLQRDDSITWQLWRKHMRPWQPGSGNRLLKMSEEEKTRLLDHLRPFMETMDAHFGRRDSA